jgi:hypothetical protein
MSGANDEERERAGGPEGAAGVPTQRRESCICGHPDVAPDHGRAAHDGGACSPGRTGSELAEQLVAALRRGR